MRLFQLVCVVLSVACSADPGTSEAQLSPWPSNLELLSRAVGQSCEQIAQRVELPSGSPLRLTCAQQVPLGWLVESELVRLLLERGFAVILSTTPTDSSAAPHLAGSLTYRPLRLQVSYADGKRDPAAGGALVTRSAASQIYYTLVEEGSGRALAAGSAVATVVDTVPAAEIIRLEASPVDPVHVARTETRWGRLWEPVVVSGVIGGLIYLFYSTRATP
jgi:hypothetical protein